MKKIPTRRIRSRIMASRRTITRSVSESRRKTTRNIRRIKRNKEKIKAEIRKKVLVNS